MRSTGLGKTELRGDISSLEPHEGLLILNVQTTSPVQWHVRAGMQRKDILKLLTSVFNFKVIKFLVGITIGKPKEPSEF
ncbi:MAG: hypothetical protein JSV03_00390 [Planctomycetota bacterium]|nr:MAG: hypothetical protein JSV03_00390 [Planctomycetota bacterium]